MTTTHGSKPVLIAGAGIGGLSAAIALARAGIPTLVVDRVKAFSPEGAGIQLGPNATRILADWDVLDYLEKDAVASEGIIIGDGISGAQLNMVPFGASAELHFGAPFLLAHRADLHNALLKTARSHNCITIKLNCTVTGFRQDPDGASIQTSTGSIEGDGLICADGTWSTLRDHVDEGASLRFTGRTAWRTLLDADQVPKAAREPWTRLWLAPKAHVVHYPVSNGKKINVVAVIDDAAGDQIDGWNGQADTSQLYPAFAHWNEHVAQMVFSGPEWRKWPLYMSPPLRNWMIDRIVLLGDAAHPVLPFLAQGGAMAIEDAAVLGKEISKGGTELPEAFRSFELARIERTARTSYESRKLGNIYHMGGLARAARDFVLRLRKPLSLRERYEWLYGFRVTDD